MQYAKHNRTLLVLFGDEFPAVEKAAGALGLTVAEFVRRIVLAEVRHALAELEGGAR